MAAINKEDIKQIVSQAIRVIQASTSNNHDTVYILNNEEVSEWYRQHASDMANLSANLSTAVGYTYAPSAGVVVGQVKREANNQIRSSVESLQGTGQATAVLPPAIVKPQPVQAPVPAVQAPVPPVQAPVPPSQAPVVFLQQAKPEVLQVPVLAVPSQPPPEVVQVPVLAFPTVNPQPVVAARAPAPLDTGTSTPLTGDDVKQQAVIKAQARNAGNKGRFGAKPL